MDAKELESYLHAQIPASGLLQFRVRSCSIDKVELTAPMAPNINHKHTVFGGSLSMLAILSGWALVNMRLSAQTGGQQTGAHHEIVIQESRTSYLKPAVTDVTATCSYDPADRWDRFERMLLAKGKARIKISSDVRCHGEVVATHQGSYVALKKDETE